jgi:hypothetical protein
VRLCKLTYASFQGGAGAPVRVRMEMHRVTARLLLLVLLVGTIAPLAVASSMPAVGPHCNRKSAPAAPVMDMPGCHHASSASHHHAEAAAAPADQVLDADHSCCDHECCRSMARSQWAHVSLKGRTQTLEPATRLTSAPRSRVRSFELALYRPVRAPPVL